MNFANVERRWILQPSFQAYRTDNTGWDGSLVAGVDTDIPMPIPTPAAVGGTFSPGWARNRNHVIGVGIHVT